MKYRVPSVTVTLSAGPERVVTNEPHPDFKPSPLGFVTPPRHRRRIKLTLVWAAPGHHTSLTTIKEIPMAASDTYYADQQVLSHICPFCDSYQLEAPETWDPAEVQEILGAHVVVCLGFDRQLSAEPALKVKFT